MVELGRSVADISRSLGIGENLIYQWKTRQKSIIISQEPASAFDDEKAALHKRIHELEQERDILKKALVIFSRLI